MYDHLTHNITRPNILTMLNILRYNVCEVSLSMNFVWICLNRLEGTCYTKWDVSLSWSKDICEGCSQLRRTVICLRKRTIRRQYLSLYDDNHRKSRK